jgi:hypothetical protein
MDPGGGASHPRTGLSAKFPGIGNSAPNSSKLACFSPVGLELIRDITGTYRQIPDLR